MQKYRVDPFWPKVEEDILQTVYDVFGWTEMYIFVDPYDNIFVVKNVRGIIMSFSLTAISLC